MQRNARHVCPGIRRKKKENTWIDYFQMQLIWKLRVKMNLWRAVKQFQNQVK